MNRKSIWLRILSAALVAGALGAHYLLDPWGFYWKVSSEEAEVRLSLVAAAECYLGANEADGSYLAILERYNSQDSLPQGYSLTESDSWCAAFVTVAAMDAGLTDILPPECSCQRQIEAFQALGRWEEDDGYIPLPGDIIYYDWDETSLLTDCTGWADHVGIVVGVKWPFIKVIEGNRDDQVCYRILPINALHIRGYGKPDYESLLSSAGS